MTLNPSMGNALQGAAPLVCLLLEIELPSHTIRISDGGPVIFGGQLFDSQDSVYGVLDQVETVTDALGTEAPKVRFGFLPASLPAMAEITNPTNQGSPVKLWFGAIDQATGWLIGEPELLFLGELDTAEFEATESATVITFDVASAWERLFDSNEGLRLNNAFLQSVWPGALGFEYITHIQRRLPWNQDARRPTVVRDVNGGGGGSGSFTGGGGGYGGGGRWDGNDMVVLY